MSQAKEVRFVVVAVTLVKIDRNMTSYTETRKLEIFPVDAETQEEAFGKMLIEVKEKYKGYMVEMWTGKELTKTISND